MTRIRVGAKMPALLFLAPLAGFALVAGCIPDPDTSPLPPFEASTSVIPDSTAMLRTPAWTPRRWSPATVMPVRLLCGAAKTWRWTSREATPGMRSSLVWCVDYTQGNGQGVVPGREHLGSERGRYRRRPRRQTPTASFTLSNVPVGAGPTRYRRKGDGPERDDCFQLDAGRCLRSRAGQVG